MTNIYNVLVRPLVTEKSSYQSGKLSQYAFVVADEATRTMVKDAVETLFDVTVARVNILNAPAKRGRRTRSRPASRTTSCRATTTTGSTTTRR